MAEYITNRGTSAGPIHITTIKDKSRLGTWLVSDGYNLLVGEDWKINSDSGLSGYRNIIADSSLMPNEPNEPHMLVNAQWVRNYVTGGSGGSGTGSTGVSELTFNNFKSVVLGTNLNYTSPSILSVAQGAQTTANQAIVRLDALDRDTEILKTQINNLNDILTNHLDDFEDYKTNPYPEGVIFIGGGAY